MTYTPRRKVGYFYDSDVGNFYYAQGHPMKPHRMRMTHNLLVAYGVAEKMEVLSTPRASERDMTRFHADEYISFLKNVTPELIGDHSTNLTRFNVLEDCPVFDGLWEYCQIAAGGSLAGAARLNNGQSDIAVNWAGGLHHAKKAEASGFCYINDCVLAILELLKVHSRVLYVDIDIHHGDGVEEAFYTTDRVMTASFHKFGDYFPGTGDSIDIGIGKGKYYSANFPLRDGIDDESYRLIFEPVMERIMEWYRPSAVVLQCGADSLSGDRLGCFNLSLRGHAHCVDFFKRYDVPLLMLGGGGYTIRNVARCWAYETSRVVGETLPDQLPYNDNYEFYGPEFRLHIVPSNMENHNSPTELQKTTVKIFEHLRHLPHAPSTGFIDSARTPALGIRRLDDDDHDPDVRQPNRRVRHVVDYEGSDIEDDDQYISSLRRAKRKQRRINFPRRRFPAAESPKMPGGSPMRVSSPRRAVENVPNGEANSTAERPDENMTEVRQNGVMEDSNDESLQYKPLADVKVENRDSSAKAVEEADDDSLRHKPQTVRRGTNGGELEEHSERKYVNEPPMYKPRTDRKSKNRDLSTNAMGDDDDDSLPQKTRADRKAETRDSSAKVGLTKEGDNESLRHRARAVRRGPIGEELDEYGGGKYAHESLVYKSRTNRKVANPDSPAKAGAAKEGDDDSVRQKPRTAQRGSSEEELDEHDGGEYAGESPMYKSQIDWKDKDHDSSEKEEDAEPELDVDADEPPKLVMKPMHRFRRESRKQDAAPGGRRTTNEDAGRGRSMMESSFREAVNRRLRDQAEDGTDEMDADRTNGNSTSDGDEERNLDEPKSRTHTGSIQNGTNDGENGTSREEREETLRSREGGAGSDDQRISVLREHEDLSRSPGTEAQQRPEMPELYDSRESALLEGGEDAVNNDSEDKSIEGGRKSTEEDEGRSDVGQQVNNTRPVHAPRIDTIVEGLQREEKDINATPSNRDTSEEQRGLQEAEKDLRRTEMEIARGGM